MAGKEDPVRNFGVVSRGSAPAEKVEAELDGIKVGAVPSAFMPQPLPSGRHKRGEKKADLVYGGLRPCSGSHTPTPTAEELQQSEADLVCGGSLMACSARRTLGDKKTEKDSVTGGKRKVEDSEPEGEGVSATVVPAVGESIVDKATGIKYVDMPENFLCWILSQKRLSPAPYDPRQSTILSQEQIEREVASVEKLKALQAGVKDEFFAFQAWVRETYETKGRVLVPEDFIPEAFTSGE